MKKIIFIVLLLFVVIVTISSIGLAMSVFDWKTYETDNFIIFYPEGYEEKAEQTLFFLEKYRSKVDLVTGNNKNFKT